MSKRKIAEWWSRHPQDYLGWEAPDAEGEATLSDYVQRADQALMRDHGDLHQGDRLFHALLPYDRLKEKDVLELGCGLGAVTHALARAGCDATGLDLSEFGIKATAWRLDRSRLPLRVVRGDAESLPFGDASFDFVWSWGVIHHSPNTAASVTEIQRILRPGGEAVVMVYHRHGTDALLNVLLRYGVLRGELLRHSVDELLTRYSDGKAHGGCPLAQYFTRGAARQMFANFRRVEIVTHGYRSGLMRAFPERWGLRRTADRLLPEALTRWISRNFGHFLVIRAVK